MQLKLIDENRYAEDMNGRVLPALAECRVEGWMEPAEVAGLQPRTASMARPAGDCITYATIRRNSTRCVRTARPACSAAPW